MRNVNKYTNKYKDICFEISNNTDKYKNEELLKKMSLAHKNILKSLLTIKNECNEKDKSSYIISKISNLMNFTLYTRDKYYGMGSYEMFLYQFLNYCKYHDKGLIHINNIALLLQKNTQRMSNEENIGSWYDLKQLANDMLYYDYSKSHPVMNLIISIFSKQISQDINTINNVLLDEKYVRSKITWCAKWIPREKSSSAWMVPLIVKKMYNLENRRCANNHYYSYLKKYRKNIAKINKFIDTPEIKLCNNSWCEIDFTKTSSIFMKKYFNNFTNVRSDFDSDDRKESVVRFKKHMKNKVYTQMNKDEYIETIYFHNYKNIDYEEIVSSLKSKQNNYRYSTLFMNYKF